MEKKTGHGTMRDIGDVRSSCTTGESRCQRQKIVQRATRIITVAAHLKGFASMTEGL
jgi:hypothetical protein